MTRLGYGDDECRQCGAAHAFKAVGAPGRIWATHDLLFENQESTVPAPSSLPSAVVLLIQPERDDRDMYAEFLRHEGVTLIILSEAAPALIVAPDSDVIVTELLLPGSMEGIELIVRLRSDRSTSGIPIIVLTTSAWDTERERAQRAGCDMFLPKPCGPDQLLAEIQRQLAKSATWTGQRPQAHTTPSIEPESRRHPKRTA